MSFVLGKLEYTGAKACLQNDRLDGLQHTRDLPVLVRTPVDSRAAAPCAGPVDTQLPLRLAITERTAEHGRR